MFCSSGTCVDWAWNSSSAKREENGTSQAIKKTSEKKRKKRRRKKSLRAESPRRSKGRRNNFKPAVFPHYHSAADRRRRSEMPASECLFRLVFAMVLNRISLDERGGAPRTHSDGARCHCSIGGGPRRWAQTAGCSACFPHGRRRRQCSRRHCDAWERLVRHRVGFLPRFRSMGSAASAPLPRRSAPGRLVPDRRRFRFVCAARPDCRRRSGGPGG